MMINDPNYETKFIIKPDKITARNTYRMCNMETCSNESTLYNKITINGIDFLIELCQEHLNELLLMEMLRDLKPLQLLTPEEKELLVINMMYYGAEDRDIIIYFKRDSSISRSKILDMIEKAHIDLDDETYKV